MKTIGSGAYLRGWLIAMGLLLSLTIEANGGETVAYMTHIKPLFDRHCASCHGKDAPEHGDFKRNKEGYKNKGLGPKMDSYAHLVSYTGWPDSGAIMRRLDDGKHTRDGKPGNMYVYLGANEEERQRNLDLFKAWVANWTLKRFPDMTKDELGGISVTY